MENYKLSIAIPIFNKWNFTKSCLNDLMQLPEDHEIVIIDNGSSDETQKELKSYSRIKVFRNEINLGFAKSCNLSFSKCNSNNIMFLNNDIKVKSNHIDWTKNIIESIKNNCLVGPTGGYVDLSNNFNFVYETNDPKKKINYMSGWCLTASKQTWSKLSISRDNQLIDYPQIFSEDFFCYFEDTDLSFRAKKLGIKFELIDIPVVHFGQISSSQLNTNALYSKAKQIFIKKWSKV